ncbi:MAG TPA: polysaccharide deacetylase family protein, partial [Thermoanaerobaculia bacterium]|nr:polysaccharide deacetylase family protein [Thermoanaerobaculia bacterium]
MSNHVFHDPSNRRWRWIRVLLVAAALVSTVGLSIFAFSVAHIVSLPQARLSDSVKNGIHSVIPHLPQRRKTLQQFLRSRTRRQLLDEISREKLRTRSIVQTATPSTSLVAAFYAPWQPASLRSLRANAGHITHLFPAWVHVNTDGETIDLGDWNPKLMPATSDVLDIAESHQLSVIPVINNAQGGQFDGQRLHILLNDEKLQSHLINDLKVWLERNSFEGVNIDFENLAPEDYQKLPAFIEKVRDDFDGSNLLITADLEVRNTGLDWQRVAEACDFVILMAYDEHSLLSPSGPISSIGWYRDAIDRALQTIPRSKLVVGLANYAYDWTDGVQRAVPLSYQAALLTAHDSYSSESEVVDFDQDSLNPTFNYTDPAGTGHEVWMLDGVTVANQWRVAQQYRVRGAALWVLGLEDPSVWTVLDKTRLDKPVNPATLQQISFPYDIDFIGQGEILQVDASPKAGLRTLEVDEQTGLFVDEEYVTFPTSFVIRRSGYQPKVIALTIDDGPAEPYTSDMLDELKRLNVKATFFVVGDNAYRYPDDVDRMYREGHEIGNHTFTHPNVGTISPRRAVIELNGTQRAIQSITGHSTILFRAPYNADAEPQTPEEVAPLILASRLGYLTVDEFIDPQDWNLFVSFPNGDVERRTAVDFARDVIQQVHTKGIGNGVLLHDGGGDRSETVKALPLIVNALRKEGYQFVTVSQLLHSTRDQVMPRADKEMLLMHDDRVVFQFMHWADIILEIAFISAIVLG